MLDKKGALLPGDKGRYPRGHRLRSRGLALGLCALFACHPSARAQEDAAAEIAEPSTSAAETVTVTATRSGKRVQDEPIHVELIDPDEIQEGTAFTPGQIGQLLGETSGIRLQVTSPSLGAANLSIQGLKGHYTQILSDGLPLYGAQTESLGVLQIPPADLGRVEIIKGVASALYGPSALGGVVNLIAQRPEPQFQQEYIANATTLSGQDAVAYASGPISDEWGFTVLAGLNRQGQSDLNHDGWVDVPSYNRTVLRPRLFWDDNSGASIFVTAGVTDEGRHGGTLAGRVAPDGNPFPEQLDTQRVDMGAVGRFSLDDAHILNVRGSVMDENDAHAWGNVTDRDDHATWFGEASLTGAARENIWTLGAATQSEIYHSRHFGDFNYTYWVPAVFAQDEYDAFEWLSIAASARVDFHNKYGTFVSPRLSTLLRLDGWSIRGSVGLGNYAPTPFTEETAETGFSGILPFQNIKAERAQAASFDVGRTLGPLELNASVFGSIIDHPVRLAESSIPGQLQFENVAGPTRTTGAELFARYRYGLFTVTGGYVYLDSSEIDPETHKREEADLTPKNAATFRLEWEDEDIGRLGFEAFYTGAQSLNDPLNENPYRTRGTPYLVIGALAEYRLTKNLSLFVNAENLTDVRQTKFDPLLRPTRAPDGRWTVDAWAPLDGRTVNGGLEVRF